MTDIVEEGIVWLGERFGKIALDLITNSHWNRDKSDEWSWVGENVMAYTV